MMAHYYTGVSEDAVPVIRGVVEEFIGMPIVINAMVEEIVKALTAAGYTVIKNDHLDGATTP